MLDYYGIYETPFFSLGKLLTIKINVRRQSMCTSISKKINKIYSYNEMLFNS